MRPDITPLELKRFIIDTLSLEDLQPEGIQDDEPLFSEALGLDSIDALELGIALQKRFQMEIFDGKNPEEIKLWTVRTLVEFIAANGHPNQ
jgi:acyl carrier protein